MVPPAASPATAPPPTGSLATAVSNVVAAPSMVTPRVRTTAAKARADSPRVAPTTAATAAASVKFEASKGGVPVSAPRIARTAVAAAVVTLDSNAVGGGSLERAAATAAPWPSAHVSADTLTNVFSGCAMLPASASATRRGAPPLALVGVGVTAQKMTAPLGATPTAVHARGEGPPVSCTLPGKAPADRAAATAHARASALATLDNCSIVAFSAPGTMTVTFAWMAALTLRIMRTLTVSFEPIVAAGDERADGDATVAGGDAVAGVEAAAGVEAVAGGKVATAGAVDSGDDDVTGVEAAAFVEGGGTDDAPKTLADIGRGGEEAGEPARESERDGVLELL
jgi:hypothetical protein